MAAKSKKRLSKIESKLLKLDKLQLKDVICSICQSILVEPVTLPCYHNFCKCCFNGTIENNSLCCPLCRLRIGSWLRTSTKQKSLVNTKLWNFIKAKFSQEVDFKISGEDFNIPQEKPKIRLSVPGEIRSEYEAEVQRLKVEQINLEQKQFQETENLIRRIQEEEEEACRSEKERLKKDELLAQQIQSDTLHQPCSLNSSKNFFYKTADKPRLKATKIDIYLSKDSSKISRNQNDQVNERATHTVSNSTIAKYNTSTSPEMVPGYDKCFQKLKIGIKIWNKENGESSKKQFISQTNEIDKCHSKAKSVQSLPVSLPYTGILRHKLNIPDYGNIETDSVDSMRQELCYFKPIEGKTPTSFNTHKGMPLRVPGKRAENAVKSISPQAVCAPSRAQYLEGLCQLRNMSLSKNLPSAFVLAFNMLRVKKETSKCDTNSKQKIQTSRSINEKKQHSVKNKQTNGLECFTKLNSTVSLRRTRSMGSISKEENETTPKKTKIKERKASSERKPYLRSDTKKSHRLNNLPSITESLNNNKVSFVKNLSSPLKNCDVEMILEEQLRIEKIIEQEKMDLELARRVEAEWNGRRQPRRASSKRQLLLNHALRPAKKLKV